MTSETRPCRFRLAKPTIRPDTIKMAPTQSNHPLPTPPGQQHPGSQQPSHQPAQHSQRPANKPRRSRGLSFRSDHSSGSKENKDNLIETHREKEAKRLHTKADPTMALSEIEPGMMPTHMISLLSQSANPPRRCGGSTKPTNDGQPASHPAYRLGREHYQSVAHLFTSAAILTFHYSRSGPIESNSLETGKAS